MVMLKIFDFKLNKNLNWEGKIKLQRFFKEIVNEKIISLDGEERQHIVKSLRMKVGEKLVVCDGNLTDYFCEIAEINKEKVLLKVLKKEKNNAEPNVNFHIFQAIPKLSKLEFIIQKSVELGAKSLTPVVSMRSFSAINNKNAEKKLIRFQKIAQQAAAQSARGIVPKINNILNFEDAIIEMKKNDVKILFYEYADEKLNNISVRENKDVSLMIGSEGGFDEKEVEFAKKEGVAIKSLGNRILRCETAPICALSVLLYITKNL